MFALRAKSVERVLHEATLRIDLNDSIYLGRVDAALGKFVLDELGLIAN
jgi:hypothetical protein